MNLSPLWQHHRASFTERNERILHDRQKMSVNVPEIARIATQSITNSTVSGLFNQLKTSAFGGANEIGVERRERQVSSHGEFEIGRVI
jgi:hypothetical protein